MPYLWGANNMQNTLIAKLDEAYEDVKRTYQLSEEISRIEEFRRSSSSKTSTHFRRLTGRHPDFADPPDGGHSLHHLTASRCARHGDSEH